MTKFTDNRFLRFVLVGGLNTLLTYLAYLLFLIFVDYHVAFSISFVLGIVVAYLLNSLAVFKVAFSWRRLIKYPLIYFIQYGVALMLLDLEVGKMGFDRRFAPLFNVVLLLPFTFFLNRWFLIKKAE